VPDAGCQAVERSCQLVLGLVAEHGFENIAAAPCQGDDGGVVLHILGALRS
jgi:hypothetical protein